MSRHALGLALVLLASTAMADRVGAQSPVSQPLLRDTTFENFVSLEYSARSGNKRNRQATITDDGGMVVTTSSVIGARVEARRLRLTDYAALFKALNDAKFLTFAGDYRQAGLAD